MMTYALWGSDKYQIFQTTRPSVTQYSASEPLILTAFHNGPAAVALEKLRQRALETDADLVAFCEARCVVSDHNLEAMARFNLRLAPELTALGPAQFAWQSGRILGRSGYLQDPPPTLPSPFFILTRSALEVVRFPARRGHSAEATMVDVCRQLREADQAWALADLPVKLVTGEIQPPSDEEVASVERYWQRRNNPGLARRGALKARRLAAHALGR